MRARLPRYMAFSTVIVLGAQALGCTPPGSGGGGSDRMDTTARSTAAAGEWRTLFDGRNMDQWRGFRRSDVPAGWKVVDGTLTRTGEAGDLITRDTFRDFELELEWKVEPGGNSGVMYRVTEEGENTYDTGPEMQVLDDARHPDGQSPLTSAGALYGMYPAPRGVVRPAGEWNRARVVADGNHVEHWLNSVKVVEAEIGSADWNSRVAAGKWVERPLWAKSPSGHIALQDHGDVVAYRNIRIRELP